MLSFTITTPERVVYETSAESISLPTVQGEITILPNHIPLVAIVAPGAITVRKNNKEEYLSVSGGFITVRPGIKVTMLADTAEKAEELTIEAIEKAREQARKMLTQTRVVDEELFTSAAAALERELARLKVARKHRARGGMHIEEG